MIPSAEAWGGRPLFSTHDPSRVEAVDIPSSNNPAELLAWDDAFLEETEATGRQFLWFWESPVPFVVVGYGQTIPDTVHVEACRHANVPILRRRSGGGTVIQGPGCLCYGITLDPRSAPALESIDSTNRWILESQISALQPLMETRISIEGHTDLALTLPQGKRKFSGNAQRRTRGAILFHGTFLHGLDIRCMADLLKLPVDRPAYRDSRDHHDFLTRIPIPPDRIRVAIRNAWGAIDSDRALPRPRHQQAIALRYGQAAWHWSRSAVRGAAPLGVATRSHAF